MSPPKRAICIMLLLAAAFAWSACAEGERDDAYVPPATAMSELSAIECHELRALAAEARDPARQRLLRQAYERCRVNERAAQERGEKPEVTPRTGIDHCVRIRRLAFSLRALPGGERLRRAYAACLDRDSTDAPPRTTDHCGTLRELYGSAEDPALQRRIYAAWKDCRARDEAPPEVMRHCLEIRRRAAAAEDAAQRDRLLAAYHACVDANVERDEDVAPLPLPPDHCMRLRAAAAQSDDPREARRLIEAYYQCADAEGAEPGRCGDGTALACRMMEPTCAEGEVLTIEAACYACVPAHWCMDEEDDCLELRRLASLEADAMRRQRLIDAWLACSQAGEEELPSVTCRTVRCASGYRCVEGPRGPFCQEEEGVACRMIWDPVCGADGRTYGNACEANAAGARVAYAGECLREPPQDVPDACPMVWDPVCGVDGRTYANACLARLEGVAVRAPGECPSLPVEPDPAPCTAEFAPVCGEDGRTYSNACVARSAGVRVVHRGECDAVEPDPSEEADADDRAWCDELLRLARSARTPEERERYERTYRERCT